MGILHRCAYELEPVEQTQKLKRSNVYINLQNYLKNRKEKSSSDELVSSTYPKAIFVSKDQEH